MLFPGRRTEVGPAGASSGPVSLVVLQIYQNNIRPDLPDFAPGNLAFTVLAEIPHIFSLEEVTIARMQPFFGSKTRSHT